MCNHGSTTDTSYLLFPAISFELKTLKKIFSHPRYLKLLQLLLLEGTETITYLCVCTCVLGPCSPHSLPQSPFSFSGCLLSALWMIEIYAVCLYPHRTRGETIHLCNIPAHSQRRGPRCKAMLNFYVSGLFKIN